MTILALTATLATPAYADTLEQRQNRRAICQVFGKRYCQEAIRVAHCESRWLTRATNGQYRGLFQLGSSERRLFGHGQTARAQARAAWRYFKASGYDWSPWTCRWVAYQVRRTIGG